MRILFDSNIILDIALKRIPFHTDSANSFKIIDGIQNKGSVSASSLTDIYYIIRKETNHSTAVDIIESLLFTVDVLNVNRDTIVLALHSNFSDFEDAVQNASAELNQIDIIITRNKKDFIKSKIKVYTPAEFLKLTNNNGLI